MTGPGKENLAAMSMWEGSHGVSIFSTQYLVQVGYQNQVLVKPNGFRLHGSASQTSFGYFLVHTDITHDPKTKF